MKGSGASIAASGIQLWNGIDPAFEMAPITSRIIAVHAIPCSGRGVFANKEMLQVPAVHPVSTMPASMHRSVIPTMMNAFVAVRQAPAEPIAIIPNIVSKRPSQKKSSRMRLSASTAPFAMLTEINNSA